MNELRQFLGLDNYYRWFVADYSKVVQSLHKLLMKANTFHWDSKCQHGFDELKHKLMSPPILAFVDFNQ